MSEGKKKIFFTATESLKDSILNLSLFASFPTCGLIHIDNNVNTSGKKKEGEKEKKRKRQK